MPSSLFHHTPGSGRRWMRPMASLAGAVLAAVALQGCSDSDSDDDSDNSTMAPAQVRMAMSFSGLEDLGPDYVYEGWLMDGDGNVVTAGRFDIDGAGNPMPASFMIDESDAMSAATYILTIEPVVNDPPTPSDVHILAGDFVGDDAQLDTEHMAALGSSFSTVAGKVLIATPTTTITTDNNQGYWFLDNSGSTPVAGLNLPDLPAGWVYEGWAVVDGTPYSTGTFSAVNGADSDGAGPGAGTDAAAPGYPGQDFITPALVLTPSTAVISVEPVPDNSPAPFAIKPLAGMVDAMAAGTLVTLDQNLNTIPLGTVTFGDLPMTLSSDG